MLGILTHRPEDTGRRTYHGEKEVFLSDHSDTINSATILSKCTVWELREYRVRSITRYYSEKGPPCQPPTFHALQLPPACPPPQLDGKALKALVEDSGPGQGPPLRLMHKGGARGWIHAPATGPEATFQCPAAGIADLMAGYVAEGRHQRLADFEDHMEDLSLDWFNPDLVA